MVNLSTEVGRACAGLRRASKPEAAPSIVRFPNVRMLTHRINRIVADLNDAVTTWRAELAKEENNHD